VDIEIQKLQMPIERLSSHDLMYVMLAGSCAGAVEHTLMFPVDTVKTRMQATEMHGGTRYKSVFSAFNHIIRFEGFRRLYSGFTAIIAAAVPSHAFYFVVYECMRVLLDMDRHQHHPLKTMVAGGAATMAHDFIVTPLDVIKQRMQLKASTFSNPVEAARCVCRESGWAAFIRSYPTTVLLNVPYMATQFTVYESAKLVLRKNPRLSNEESWQHHLIAGGFAGAVAGLMSNPLDVIKTRIQTDPRCGFRRISTTIREIHFEDGLKGFSRGAGARALYCIPSASLIWLTYDGLRVHFGIDIDDEYQA